MSWNDVKIAGRSDEAMIQATHLQTLHKTMTQQRQMMQFIQQQDQRLDHMADLLAQVSHRDQVPSHADNTDTKRPCAMLPGPEKFTGEDPSLSPQFLGKLQANAAAIGNGRDHVWYGFSRLDGKATARVYPWMSMYKDSATNLSNPLSKLCLQQAHKGLHVHGQD
ncbi:hypothetical protein V1509DRAFT_372298 [Lipomyces kononenkoae]